VPGLVWAGEPLRDGTRGGLSAAAGSAVLGVQAHATGTTGAATTVSSCAPPATTGGGELAIGFYADSGSGDTLTSGSGDTLTSGSGDTLTSGSGYTSRVTLAPTSDMELLVEDQGATPAATVGTGPSTPWLMAALVLKPG
jgi:hypothetical protein